MSMVNSGFKGSSYLSDSKLNLMSKIELQVGENSNRLIESSVIHDSFVNSNPHRRAGQGCGDRKGQTDC